MSERIEELLERCKIFMALCAGQVLGVRMPYSLCCHRHQYPESSDRKKLLSG